VVKHHALAGQHIIVTGASEQSIGFATAKILAQWGATVIVTSRSQTQRVVNALRTASGGDVDGHEMDLTDTDSVNTFARWYHQHHGERLDVLVNNAGIHLDLRSEWKAPHMTKDGHEIHWRTNYLGTFQLTRLMLPLLLETARQHGEARVVNVVSQLHSKGRNTALFSPLEPYNSWRAYGTSKLALVHHANEIERRHSAEGLHAYSLHPGAVYTRIADKGLAGHPFIGLLRKLLAPVEAFFLLSPEQGAQTSLHCATAAKLTGGRYYVDCKETTPSDDANDPLVADRLWQETLQWFETVQTGETA
jgi:NAD(P)-dependent dehydrogenase (short-subunit alcohol dehydrogenase family)